ncbi:MAG: N-terminal methylation site-containing protein, partial [Verrucomicrobiaceae bacterium]|nr:N-terminal methylation site-containing protein [Verrucomicrobiaceae bacterium]
MLVVIAVIGIIAAIAIPNIGNVNAAARSSTGKRNAQTLASTFSAAMAAGVDMSSYDKTTAIGALTTGVAPLSGPFKGQQFIVPNIPAAGSTEYTELATYLEWDNTSKVLNYKGGF